MPKHQATIFVVIRKAINGRRYHPVNISCCLTVERADELCGVYMQQYIDTGKGLEEMFEFIVEPLTYFDE